MEVNGAANVKFNFIKALTFILLIKCLYYFSCNAVLNNQYKVYCIVIVNKL